MENCLFCQIVDGKIPSKQVYEDDLVLAFHDIEPQAPTHLLIIPKQHIDSAADITSLNSAVIARIFEVAAKLAKDFDLKNGFRIVTNCGKDGQQSVEHIHFHLLGGRSMQWPPG